MLPIIAGFFLIHNQNFQTIYRILPVFRPFLWEFLPFLEYDPKTLAGTAY